MLRPTTVIVEDVVWAEAGAALAVTCRALSAAAYGAVQALAIRSLGARNRRFRRRLRPGVTKETAAAATMRCVCGFVRRCPRLEWVQIAWSADGDGGWSSAALEAPLLRALADGGTVKRLVWMEGDLSDALVEGVRPLSLTSRAVAPAVRHVEFADPSGELVATPDPARRPALRGLLAAVARTLTRWCVRGDKSPPRCGWTTPFP